MVSRRKKHFGARPVTFAALIAASLGVAACSSSAGSTSSGASASGDSKSLSVQIQVTQNSLIDCYIGVFKKQNPGVSVSTSIVGATAKNSTNLQVLTGHNPPDVGFIPNNSVVYPEMLAAHDLEPLNSVYTTDNLTSAYGANNAALLGQNGVPYLVSIDSLYYGVVYYNNAVLEKAGVTPPANHRFDSESQLITDAQKLSAAGYDGVSLAGESGYEATWMVDNFMNTSTTPSQYTNYLSSWEKGVPMTYPYTSAPFEQALSAISALGTHNVFEPGYLGITTGAEAEALFTDGKAGMLIDGDWEAASFKNMSVGWALLPPVTGSSEPNKLSLAAADDYGIPAGAANKALAEKFLDVVGSPQGQLCNFTAGILPGIPMPTKDYSSLPVAVQQMVSFAKTNGAQTGWSSGLPGNLAQTYADPFVQEMLNGQLTPAQLAAKVQTNILKSK
jgi:raffinose/stachyose/melibiose transport system substrate-binding protein